MASIRRLKVKHKVRIKRNKLKLKRQSLDCNIDAAAGRQRQGADAVVILAVHIEQMFLCSFFLFFWKIIAARWERPRFFFCTMEGYESSLEAG